MLICIHRQSTAFIVATSTKLTHAQRHYVGYNTINWRKSNQQMHCICVYFLKVYLFIYLFIYHTDMFRLFPSHHQGAYYMVERKNNVYIFQDTFIYVSVLRFQFIMC